MTDGGACATEPAAAKGRSRWLPGLLVWTVGAGLLAMLCLAGANWKKLHFAYCRQMLRSAAPRQQEKGIYAICKIHVRPGMARAKVEALFAPLQFEPHGPDEAELLVWRVKTDEVEERAGISIKYKDDKLDKVQYIIGGGRVPRVAP